MDKVSASERNILLKSNSWVWIYFAISGDDASIAICSQCQHKITRGNKEKTCKTFTITMLHHIITK